MKRPFFYFGWFVILLTLGFYVRYYYLAYYPFRTIVADNPQVITRIVTAGDDLIYQTKYCRYFKGSGTVTRTLVGPDFIPTPTVQTVTNLGCNTATVHLTVPSNASPGIYHMEVVAEFKVNEYQTVTKNYTSNTFQVIK